MVETGCRFPLPALCEVDAAAWMIFQDCATQWEMLIHPFGGVARVRLRYDMVKLAAEAHGFEFDGELLDRVRVCERWLLAYDREKQRAAADAKAEQEPVN